jgi:hypothetical protein
MTSSSSTHRPAGHPVARVLSARDPALTYEVRYVPGFYVCSCPTFLFRARCSHVEQVAATGVTAPLAEGR